MIYEIIAVAGVLFSSFWPGEIFMSETASLRGIFKQQGSFGELRSLALPGPEI